MIGWIAYLATITAALVTAILLARRTPYRPVVAVLAIGLVIDLALGHKDVAGLGAYLATRRPYQGIDVWLYHLGNGLTTAWPVAVAALAWWALKDERPEPKSEPSAHAMDPRRGQMIGPVRSSPFATRHDVGRSMRPAWLIVKAVVAWLLANAALVWTWVPGDEQRAQRGLFIVEALAIIAGFIAWRFRTLAWTASQRAALWLLAVEVVVVLLGPFRLNIYADWGLARVAYGIGFTALAVGQWKGRTWTS
jgi:hypothetical protein